MGANKKYFTDMRSYFSQKYSFIKEEMIWETLDCDTSLKDIE